MGVAGWREGFGCFARVGIPVGVFHRGAVRGVLLGLEA
jgi:hypothetical protein